MRKAVRSTPHDGEGARPRNHDSIVDLWILRALVPLRGYRDWRPLVDWEDKDEISERLRLPMSNGKRRLTRNQVVSALRLRHAQAETTATTARFPSALARNCAVIAKQIGLDPASKRILAFTVLLKLTPVLEAATDLLGDLNYARLCVVLGGLLKLPVDAVNHALSATGPLIQSGLLRASDRYTYCLNNKLDLVNEQFAGRMLSAIDHPIDLFRDTLLPAPPAQLTLDDFEHVHGFVDISLALVRKALAERRQGVNIFVHGLPGTGKSEFSRALSDALGTDLLQVSSEDEDGDPIGGEKRLRAFRAALHLVARGNTLLVFDEAEDIFSASSHPFSLHSAAQQNKAWVNRMLESNAVPCLWLSNSTRDLDAAFIRRFDLVFEMPIPPMRRRAEVIRSLCGDFVSPSDIDRLAAADHLAPAVVARAVDVARRVQEELAQETTDGLVTRLVDQTLIAQGRAPLRATTCTSAFDPVCAPTDTDLDALAQGIARTGSARLCLYGPPGTGKTAFARWLAERVDRPLASYQVSDLLGMYVGQSERRLADAFHRANQTGAVLLLDEVDSFLYDRRDASHSWEVTLVNELLTQMEAFGGILLAATNRMDHLDPAALRRFDVKLRFNYLRPEQAWRLLGRYASVLRLRAPASKLKPELAVLAVLTPGDFAAVARRACFAPLADAAAFVAELRAECALKPDRPSRPIGFVSAP